MPKPQTFKPSFFKDRIKMLIYGLPGAGKTYFIGTAAKQPERFGRILILATDPGMLTLAFDEDMDERIEVALIRHTDDLERWYRYLLLENPKEPPDKRFGTVVLEGLTDLANMCMDECLKFSHQNDSKVDPDQPLIQHHGKVKIMVRREVIRFRDLGLHFVATALEKVLEDEKTKAKFIGPSVTSGLGAEVPAYFDIVGRLSTRVDPKTKEVERVLQTEKSADVIAKDRTRRLEAMVVNPSMPGIYDSVNNTPEAVKPVPTADVNVNLKKAKV